MSFDILKLKDVTLLANTGADAIKRAPIVNKNTGLKCLRIGDVSQKRPFCEWGNTLTTKEDYIRYKLEQNDIIIARTGNTIGVNCFIEKDINAVYNNGLIRIKANTNKIIPKFMYYIVSGEECQNYVQSIAFGTSTQPNMKINDFLNFEFKYIDIKNQEKIVEILSTIDDKIELNNSINNNLEQQAQAIFKSWFVDFEPFGGTMPDNWIPSDIYSISNIIYGAPFASKKFNTSNIGKPIVRIRDLKSEQLSTYTDEIHPKGYLLQLGDIVVGMDGEFRPYLWGNDEAWLNQRVCVFENKNKLDKAFVYFTIKPLLNAVEQTEVATTVIHIGKNDFDKFELNLPSRDILNHFGEITTPMIEKIVQNKLENKRLAFLRDTLLPKLMSGEIDVSNIDISTDKLSFSEDKGCH